jgi:hypothetical protein
MSFEASWKAARYHEKSVLASRTRIKMAQGIAAMKGVNVKDPLWWVSPQFRDKVIDLDGLFEFPAGSLKVVGQGQEAADAPVFIEHGEFSTLGAMLFMINGHRPGPVKGFYVVVQAKQGEAWCVGQLHADSVTPLRVFADKLYDSEAAARRAAERMRLDEWGNKPPHMT